MKTNSAENQPFNSEVIRETYHLLTIVEIIQGTLSSFTSGWSY